MFKFNVKWTTAESSLAHFALSLLVSIVMSVFTAGAQYLYSGKFNGQELAVIASAAFIAAFSRGIISLESNPNLMPAILDAVKQLQTLATVQQPATIAPQGPPVVVNVTHPAIVEPPASQAAVRELRVFPVPPRPVVQPPIQTPAQQPPDIAAVNTAQVPVPPSLPDMPQRNWNNSGLIPAVQQPTGQ